MTTTTVELPAIGAVPLTYTRTGSGTGRPILLLHGGGGPRTVQAWGERLAATHDADVLVPVYPGFDGTPRPDALTTVAGLAAGYVALLEQLDLTGVAVIGNSMGGWVAAEMAVLGSSRVSHYVLVDAVGLEVTGHPVVDFFAISFDELQERSFFDPATFAIDPAALPPQAQAAMAGNREAIGVYARTMTDPTLAPRLADVDAPFDVVWGEADRIADADYGRAYAAAVPGGRFQLLRGTGHMPQIETPELLVDTVWPLVSGVVE